MGQSHPHLTTSSQTLSGLGIRRRALRLGRVAGLLSAPRKVCAFDRPGPVGGCGIGGVGLAHLCVVWAVLGHLPL